MATRQELESLWTNVKVIVGGLQAYGEVWDGIEAMASEFAVGGMAPRRREIW